MTKLAEQLRSISGLSRRQMVALHRNIHGIDYISMPDSNTLDVYFIKPDTSISLYKDLPEFSVNDVDFTVIKDGVTHEPEIMLAFDNDNYKVAIKPDISLCDATDTTLRISLTGCFIDRFFSQAEYNLANFDAVALEQGSLSNQDYKPLPRLDYLSKDYDSFRKMIEQELTRSAPAWKETNAADIMVAISEVLAYSGDFLSYQQDSVATEAYLETARIDVSLKRHCRLLDYHIKTQVNARTWVKIDVFGEINIPKGTPLFCGGDEAKNTVLLENEFRLRSGGREVVFETMHDILCRPEYNSIKLFSWGEDNFTLNVGVTEAALDGWTHFKQGQVIVFTYSKGRQQSQVVRLKSDATFKTDALSGKKYTLVRWFDEDKLHNMWQSLDCIIHGNVVLVDRGETISYEPLELVQHNAIYFSALEQPNIIYAQKYCHATAKMLPAVKAIKQKISKAIPVIKLTESVLPISEVERQSDLFVDGSEHWFATFDFLSCTPYSRNIVVEDCEGGVRIRFGDGVYGACPSSASNYYANYRITPHVMPKVATGAINQIHLRNSLGVDLDQIEAVSSLTGAFDASSGERKEISKKMAPMYHWSRENLALPEDYIRKIREFTGVRDVYFNKGWAGSRSIYDFYIYPVSEMSRQWLKEISSQIAEYKVTHHRFALHFFRPLLLQIMVDIKIKPGFYVNDMLLKLKNRFSDNEINGFFAKEKFGFGQALYPSEIIKSAFSLDGIFSAELKSFQRLDDYVGSDEQNTIVEKITPKASEVISYVGDGRQSSIKFSINGRTYV
jgi:hypothetical protein